MKKEEIIKIRCNNCMSYFDYTEDFFECPKCKTSSYLMNMTKEDIKNEPFNNDFCETFCIDDDCEKCRYIYNKAV